MKSRLHWNTTDREFIEVVSCATFTNPFSPEREQAVLSLAGVSEGTSRELIRQRVQEAVGARFAQWEAQGYDHLDALVGEDRELMENLFLFQVYYRYLERIDELIERQLKEGARSCHVGFSMDLIQDLEKRGFSHERALHYLALFYQIRRAFYFIDRTLIGESDCMKQLRLQLWNNVFTYDIRWYNRHLINNMEDFSLLLLGETGTGKGASASAIGRSGFVPFDEAKGCFVESFASAFLSINLSQFPEQLIESELFGHRKGSFTGAIDHYQGVFARSSKHGAIFLDEIGDVDVPTQVKLLRVLQERLFSPVGSRELVRFSGRVIAATNKSIPDLRAKGAFRDDFFYRLCSDIIVVPTLQQRLAEYPEELDALVQLILERLTSINDPSLLREVLKMLRQNIPPNYNWPGNVRELEQAVRRVLLTRHYRADLPQAPPPALALSQPNLPEGWWQALQAGVLSADQVLANYCGMLYEKLGTYEEVARRTGLDRRTVKKYILKEEALS